jgi:hypothetical protein
MPRARFLPQSLHFWIKIVVATMTILLSTLLLNSILSISSFEKIYTRSLIATLETASTNLVQSIERGVRLGKPLAAFEGMDGMLATFLVNNPNLNGIAVTDHTGQLLYFKGTATADQALFAQHGRQYGGANTVLTQRYDQDYLIQIPIRRSDGAQIGAVLSSFSQEIIGTQIKTMAISALQRLGWSLGLTSIILVILLVLFVIRPIQKDLERIQQGLLSDPSDPHQANLNEASEPQTVTVANPVMPVPLAPDTETISNDIVNIGVFLQRVAIDVQATQHGLQSMHQTLADMAVTRHELSLYQTLLQSWLDHPELPAALSPTIAELIADNRNTIALLDQLPAPDTNIEVTP